MRVGLNDPAGGSQKLSPHRWQHCYQATTVKAKSIWLNNSTENWKAGPCSMQFVDFKAKSSVISDRVVFWKLAHWLARKYRTRYRFPDEVWCVNHRNRVRAKRGFYLGKTNHDKLSGENTVRLVGQGKQLFRWRPPYRNPYLMNGDQKQVRQYHIAL